MTRRSNALRFLAILLALFGLSYPIESIVADEWRIVVRDGDGNVVPGAVVRQIWKYYSLEEGGHEEDKVTNSEGIVVFPKRTIRSSLAMRILGAGFELVRSGAHASFGPSCYAIAFSNGRQGSVDWKGQDSEIILKPRP